MAHLDFNGLDFAVERGRSLEGGAKQKHLVVCGFACGEHPCDFGNSLHFCFQQTAF